jgi:aromatic ring-opening dioxygenase LigB subunit
LDPRCCIPKEDTFARRAADAISEAAYTAGEWFSSFDLDVVFLSSPHGIALSKDFAVYLNDVGSGSVSIGNEIQNTNNKTDSASSSAYTINVPSIPLAPSLAKQLLKDLQQDEENVTGVGSPDNNMPLYWGELIPLLLIPPFRDGESMEQRYLRTSTIGRHAYAPLSIQPQHLIWTHPLRRYHQAEAMIEELLRLGCFLGDWLEHRPERIGVVVSGDLSHTHRPDGPYGYSPTSALMDAALGSWASSPCDRAHDLLVSAASMQSQALSCGFTGLVLLHGMLCGSSDGISSGSKKKTDATRPSFNSQVLVNRNSTYYGMMVAEYRRQG